jgi:hypothetical protein
MMRIMTPGLTRTLAVSGALLCLASAVANGDRAGAAQEQPAAARSINVPASEIGWRKQDPNLPIEISLLWGDRARDGGFGEFVQLPPGFDSGLHAHSGDFHGVLIKGTWVHVNETGQKAEERLGPGSYVRQAGGGMHIDRCVSTEPCVLFLFQYARADVIWPPGKK